MSAPRLALRALLLGSGRSLLAILLIAASLCVLDLFAGHIASSRASLEYQAVIGQRMGHLAILHSGAAGSGTMFTPTEALQVIQVARTLPGIALVVPQMSVSGIASTGSRSALFFGEGIVSTPDAGASVQQLPGHLNPAARRGIAVSSGQARSLGLSHGSSVTLTGATLDAHSAPLAAEVVDIYNGNAPDGVPHAPLLMPFAMAQTLLDTERTERIVVYLNDALHTDDRRSALAAALHGAGIAVQVKTWQEQSAAYASERGASDVAFDSVAGMVFAVIAATVAATLAMNALERRREVGTLRALGMRSSAVFLMFIIEGVGMAVAGVLLSLAGSGLIAWVVNRAALSYNNAHAPGGAPMLVELDFERMAMAVLTVLAVALLAALVPAFKAARIPIAPALAV
jgi:putative ABC transport system permease protein